MTARARRRIRLGLLLGLFMAVVVPAVLLLPGSSSQQAGQVRYVNRTDPTCQGHSPCYGTIQAAVDAAGAGDRIVIQAGTYVEQVSISGKNNTTTASEADRIVIEADPGAPVGSVTLVGAVTQCTNGHAIRLQQSKFITIRGLTITGAGGQAVSLMGGNNQNQAVHLERLRIFGNGSPECNGGITTARGNPDTLVLNNLIYANGRNGFATIDADGGPHYLIGNTIHANAWSGLFITRNHDTFLVNNVITGNGTQAGSTGGRFGVSREASTTPNPAGIHLLNNLICGNRLGEINGPALDATDAGNLTPTGAEGPGVSPSPGCDLPQNVYANLLGPDGLANTGDDDFTLKQGSPAIDRGMDPRTLGLNPAFNPRLEADYAAEGIRPKDGNGNGTAEFDMGALEFNRDVTPPAAAFLDPPANAFVRQTVTVRAEATDSGTGVQDVTLSADTQSLTTSLSPAPPASPVTATANWNTTTFVDGTHTLTATATDVAGNTTSATRTVIVDNTPPDTQITGGPSGVIDVGSATFTFTGTDNLTPPQNLLFAWSLDGGPFTGFSSATTATLTGLGEGLHTFQVKARDQAGNEDPTPASQSFTVTFGPLISSVDPPSGVVGTFVTITGTKFVPGATQVAFNGVASVLRSITATTITTTVPIGAATGLLTVSTAQGTGSQAFTVTTTGDFTLVVEPDSVAAVQGTSVDLRVSAPTSGSYTGLIALGTGSLPAGVTGTFSSPTLAPNGTAILTLTTTASAPIGASSVTVTGTASIDGRTVTRSSTSTLTVQAPGQTVLAGQVRDQDDLPLAGVRISLGGITLTPLGTTDAGGNFLIPLTVTGSQIFLIDGTTLNTATTFYPAVPVTVTIQANVVNTLGFIARLRPIPAAKLTPITPGQPAVVTDPDLPGFSVTIPSGVSIIGWDGQPNSQMGVTQIPLDRSPLPPTPLGLSGGPIYLFSFGKVGGGLPTGNVVIDTPNDLGALPGESVDLYFFNEAPDGTAPNQWEQYGTGTVSEDGTRIVTDINPATGQPYGIPRFCCGARWNVRAPTAEILRERAITDPVDLATGRLFVRKTDLIIPGRIPLVIERYYRSEGIENGVFGLGWHLAPYDHRLLVEGTTLRLVQGNRNGFAFVPAGAGRWENRTEPALRGAVVTQLAALTFELRLKGGTVQRFEPLAGFPNASALARITDRNGNTLTITRESFGTEGFTRISRVTESAGRSIAFSYDAPGGRLSAVTDPLFRQVRYTYDALGRLETVTDPAGGVTRYTYDAGHRILTITDPRGITFITNEYDSQGRVIRQTQADGGVWTFTYQTAGSRVLATTVTDPRGNATTYRFNGQGFALSQTDALGQTTVFDYEPGTNLLRSTTDPLGRTTRFTYDTNGNVTSVTNPAGNVRTFAYEGTFNQTTSITDPLGNVTRFDYDGAGNLTTITDPLGATTTIAYNGFGQPTSTTDFLLNTTTFGYDGAGNLTTISDPLGNATTRTYDSVSRLTAQTDPRGYATRFTYDPLNRLTQMADALAGLTGFTYDPNGDLLTVTDARGNAITHTYDPMDRLATRSDPVGATESLQYDEAGNLTQHTDRKGQVATFGYDGLNRRVGASYADGSRTSFTYDAAGRLLTASDSVGGTILNSYDTLDRLLAQSTGLGTISYQYDPLGRRTRMDAPGQASVFYGYDAVSRLRTITQAPLNPVSIDYDALGRRTLLTLPNGVSSEYQYDNASRPVALIYRNALGLLGDLTYQYDAAGNRSRIGGSFARTLLPNPVPSATYDTANRLVALGGQNLVYDLNGNLTSDGTTTYTWDARNRLVSLTGSATNAAFHYDPLERRTRKVIGGSSTDFVYDGPNPVQELSGVAALGSSLASLGIDEYFSRTDATGTGAFLADALGSTVALTDSAGTLQTQYTYEPFGATAITGPASTNPFQYTAREHDATDLYYYRARYYHPGLQRFIGEDPIGLEGGDLNLYAYVRNSPVNWADPLGLRVINRSGHTVFIKPEREGPTIALGPGQTYPGEQDGIAIPCLYPGVVYKTVNNVDVMVTQGGYVVHFGGSLRERGGQLIEGGWKGRRWQEKLRDGGDFTWDNLSRKAREGCGNAG